MYRTNGALVAVDVGGCGDTVIANGVKQSLAEYACPERDRHASLAMTGERARDDGGMLAMTAIIGFKSWFSVI